MDIRRICLLVVFYLFGCLGIGIVEQNFIEPTHVKSIRILFDSREKLAKAITIRDKKLTRLILKMGLPDINYVEQKTGMSLLMISIQADNSKIFDYLLNEKADLNYVNEFTKETAIEIAKRNPNSYYFNKINEIKNK